MKNPILISAEASVYLATYIVYVTTFLVFTYHFGSNITSFFNEYLPKNQTISDSDINYLNKAYGNDTQLITGLESVLDFFNSFIPSNILILIFLVIPYLFQFILINLMKHKQTNRNSIKVYISNALTSITSAISSLMFFITAILLIGTLYIGFFLKMWTSGLIGFFFFMGIIYILPTFTLFFIDKGIASTIKKKIY